MKEEEKARFARIIVKLRFRSDDRAWNPAYRHKLAATHVAGQGEGAPSGAYLVLLIDFAWFL